MIKHTKKEILEIIKSYPCLEFFLKKNKVYTKYIQYSMFPQWSNNIDYINKPAIANIINFSFLFSKTKEGHFFWERLNCEYAKIYNEYF